MKIALVPLNPVIGDIVNNCDKILRFIDQAIDKQCDLIIFPELALTGYPPKDYLFFEALHELQSKALVTLKRRSKKIPIIVGGIKKNKSKGRPFQNVAFVFQNGQQYIYLLGVYLHITLLEEI